MELIYIGLLGGRIPILPPVSRSHHFSIPGEFRLYLSNVFDLERLSESIRHPVLEWQQVKKQDSRVLEDLGGWSHWCVRVPVVNYVKVIRNKPRVWAWQVIV